MHFILTNKITVEAPMNLVDLNSTMINRCGDVTRLGDTKSDAKRTHLCTFPYRSRPPLRKFPKPKT